jgi:hypothetical protein
MKKVMMSLLMPRHPRPSDTTMDHILAEDGRPLCHSKLDHARWYVTGRVVDVDSDASLCLRCAAAWKKGRK